MKKAFTMIELIFTIVIIGILSAIAIPKLAATRDDALVAQRMHSITSAANEIAAHAVAQAEIKNNLADMSQIIKSYVAAGVATSDTNKDAKIKVGEQSDCIGMKVESDTTTDLLKIYHPSSTSDALCLAVRTKIKMEDYPMVLRGTSISY